MDNTISTLRIPESIRGVIAPSDADVATLPLFDLEALIDAIIFPTPNQNERVTRGVTQLNRYARYIFELRGFLEEKRIHELDFLIRSFEIAPEAFTLYPALTVLCACLHAKDLETVEARALAIERFGLDRFELECTLSFPADHPIDPVDDFLTGELLFVELDQILDPELASCIRRDSRGRTYYLRQQDQGLWTFFPTPELLAATVAVVVRKGIILDGLPGIVEFTGNDLEAISLAFHTETKTLEYFKSTRDWRGVSMITNEERVSRSLILYQVYSVDLQELGIL